MTATDVRTAVSAVYRSRPVRTFAQTLAALLTAAVVAGQGLGSIDWRSVLSVSALAGVYALVQMVADGATPAADATQGGRHRD